MQVPVREDVLDGRYRGTERNTATEQTAQVRTQSRCGGRVSGQLDGRPAPQSGEQSACGTLHEQVVRVRADERGGRVNLQRRHAPLALGQGGTAAGGASGAPFRQGACGTIRRTRRAHAGTEIHQRLVEIARRIAVEQRLGMLPDEVPRRLGGDVRFDAKQTCEDARDVAVDGGDRLARGDAGDGSGRIAPDAGQLGPFACRLR